MDNHNSDSLNVTVLLLSYTTKRISMKRALRNRFAGLEHFDVEKSVPESILTANHDANGLTFVSNSTLVHFDSSKKMATSSIEHKFSGSLI